MKNLKFLTVAVMLTASTVAFAQFSNTNVNNASSGQARYVDTNPYDRLTISYNPLTVAPDNDNLDNGSLDAIAIAYTHGVSLSQTMPLFLETGVKLNYGFKTVDGEFSDLFNDDASSENKETKITMFYASVPVNLAYKFTLTNSDVSIQPFIGLNLKYNLSGKSVTEYEYDDDDEKDLFDKKDMGGKDATWKHFQMGWHIGAGLNYKALYLGLSYGADFSDICKKTKTSNFAVSVGYNF